MALKSDKKRYDNSTSTKEDTRQAAVAQAEKKEKRSLKEYFKGIKLELSKVVWPTKKELGSYTVVVIATCAIFALGFWLVDSGVLAALRAVLGITLN